MTDPLLHALNTLIFLTGVFVLASIVLSWVVIDHLRRILDALHTLVMQGSIRRQWVKEEHQP